MGDRLRQLYAQVDTTGLGSAVLAWSGRLLVALLILLVGGWVAGRLAAAVQRVLMRGGADPMLGSFLRNVVFVVLFVLVAVGTLDRAGVPTASLLAALGTAGLAIGLALQGSLSNLAAGILLMVFRPFRVGQTAGSPAMRSSTMARGTRRIDLVVGMGYGDDVGRAIAVVRELIAAGWARPGRTRARRHRVAARRRRRATRDPAMGEHRRYLGGADLAAACDRGTLRRGGHPHSDAAA